MSDEEKEIIIRDLRFVCGDESPTERAMEEAVGAVGCRLEAHFGSLVSH